MKYFKNNFVALLVLVLLSNTFIYSIVLETLYGNFEVTEPVLLELLESSCVNRLRHIQQYGVDNYALKHIDYSRHNHSLGVFVLLRAYGAPLKEQIAGLLHDASHTVFSHVGDSVFDHPDIKDSYQDDIHEWFLNRTDCENILSRHALTIADILHKNKQFTCLEQDLPDLCADRLEYNLQGGMLEGLITPLEIREILANLRFKNGIWYFLDSQRAKKFARLSLYLTEHVWGSPEGLLIDSWAADALKRALAIDVVTEHEIHFSYDALVWQKLTESTDSIISEKITKIKNYQQFFILSNSTDYDLLLKGKFRGINPWVLVETGFARLTELDPEFAHEFEQLKNLMAHGWYIKFI